MEYEGWKRPISKSTPRAECPECGSDYSHKSHVYMVAKAYDGVSADSLPFVLAFQKSAHANEMEQFLKTRYGRDPIGVGSDPQTHRRWLSFCTHEDECPEDECDEQDEWQIATLPVINRSINDPREG